MRRLVRSLLALSVLASLVLAGESAHADVTKDQCIDANAAAQDLRRDGKLSQARAALRVCSDPACPAMVRGDCVKRVEDLETIQPSVVFEAKDGSGADLVAVAVTLDGKPFADRLTGVALPVDPGPHVFTFTIAGTPTVTRSIVVTEGEKGRREHVVLGPLPVAAPIVATQPGETSSKLGTQRTVGLVAGGLGVVGLALGGVFGGLALSEKSAEQKDCASSTCGAAAYQKAQSDRSSGVGDGTSSTVSFLAGGALLVGGAVLFLTAPKADAAGTGSAFQVIPAFDPRGGGFVLKGTF